MSIHTLSVQDNESHKPEIAALKKMSNQIEIDKMIIITKNEEESIEVGEHQKQAISIW